MFSSKELVSPTKQEVIASSTSVLMNATSKLLSTSHEYMQNPDQQALKVRTFVCTNIGFNKRCQVALCGQLKNVGTYNRSK